MCLDIYAAEQNGKNVWQTPDTKTACLAETLYIDSFKYRQFDFRPVYGQWHNRRGSIKIRAEILRLRTRNGIF